MRCIFQRRSRLPLEADAAASWQVKRPWWKKLNLTKRQYTSSGHLGDLILAHSSIQCLPKPRSQQKALLDSRLIQVRSETTNERQCDMSETRISFEIDKIIHCGIPANSRLCNCVISRHDLSLVIQHSSPPPHLVNFINIRTPGRGWYDDRNLHSSIEPMPLSSRTPRPLRY